MLLILENKVTNNIKKQNEFGTLSVYKLMLKKRYDFDWEWKYLRCMTTLEQCFGIINNYDVSVSFDYELE